MMQYYQTLDSSIVSELLAHMEEREQQQQQEDSDARREGRPPQELFIPSVVQLRKNLLLMLVKACVGDW